MKTTRRGMLKGGVAALAAVNAPGIVRAQRGLEWQTGDYSSRAAV